MKIDKKGWLLGRLVVDLIKNSVSKRCFLTCTKKQAWSQDKLIYVRFLCKNNQQFKIALFHVLLTLQITIQKFFVFVSRVVFYCNMIRYQIVVLFAAASFFTCKGGFSVKICLVIHFLVKQIINFARHILEACQYIEC